MTIIKTSLILAMGIALTGCDDWGHPPKNYCGHLTVRSSELKKACNGDIGWADYEARFTMDSLDEYDTVLAAKELNEKAIAEHRTNDVVKISEVVNAVAEDTEGVCTNGVLKIDHSKLIDMINNGIQPFWEQGESVSMRNWKEGTNCQFEISVKLKMPIARQAVLERSQIHNLARLILTTNGMVVVSYNERAKERLMHFCNLAVKDLARNDGLVNAMIIDPSLALIFEDKEFRQVFLTEENRDAMRIMMFEGVYGDVLRVLYNPVADNISVSTEADDADGLFLTSGSIKGKAGNSLKLKIMSSRDAKVLKTTHKVSPAVSGNVKLPERPASSLMSDFDEDDHK